MRYFYAGSPVQCVRRVAGSNWERRHNVLYMVVSRRIRGSDHHLSGVRERIVSAERTHGCLRGQVHLCCTVTLYCTRRARISPRAIDATRLHLMHVSVQLPTISTCICFYACPCCREFAREPRCLIRSFHLFAALSGQPCAWTVLVLLSTSCFLSLIIVYTRIYIYIYIHICLHYWSIGIRKPTNFQLVTGSRSSSLPSTTASSFFIFFFFFFWHPLRHVTLASTTGKY